MKTKKLIFSMTILMLTCVIEASAQTVWLDELNLSNATQGNGVPMKNKSLDGKPMRIAGKTFSRGFGTHAESMLTILLNGKAKTFTANVGLDDEVNGHNPEVEFPPRGKVSVPPV